MLFRSALSPRNVGEESPDNTGRRTTERVGFRQRPGYRKGHRKQPPRLFGVRVKMCGKSARPGEAIRAADKPCGLKCHVHLALHSLAECLETPNPRHDTEDVRLAHRKAAGRPARGVGSADSIGDDRNQINDRDPPQPSRVRRGQNPAYKPCSFFFGRRGTA